MGVSRDQNSSRGRIRKQTSNMGFSKKTGARKDDPSTEPQKPQGKRQAALEARVTTPTKVRCDKVKDGQVRRDQDEVGDFGLSGSVEVTGLARQAVRMWERAEPAEPPREDTAAASASP